MRKNIMLPLGTEMWEETRKPKLLLERDTNIEMQGAN